jgi:HRAS-like suppressor 3
MPIIYNASQPALGLSVFRPAIDFLQEQDEKENSPTTMQIAYDAFDLSPQNTPQLGDLIEVDRTLYSHWALYVGNGRVIHITGEDDQDLPDTEHAVVKEGFLIEVAGSSYVRVNNKDVPANHRGLTTFDADTVVANARSMMGSRVPYNFLTKNCEHYLTEWRYGKSWSDQASVAMTAIKALKRDSSSAGHAYLVDSLNTILNGPGPNPPSPTFNRSPSVSLSSSVSSTTSNTASQTESVSYM